MSDKDIAASSGLSDLNPQSRIRRTIPKIAKLFDATKCNGCKACQVACSEWNDLRAEVGTFQGSYQNPMQISADSWTIIKFNEFVDDNKKLRWQFTHSACMHCEDPACLTACSTKGAIVQKSNGTVELNHDKCVGCGYCVSACPFGTISLNPKDSKVYKCTMCADRVQAGQEPACVKTCTTGALKFGTREDMLFIAEKRVAQLKERGYANAGLYNPKGVSGTGMVMVLHDINKPESYGLPADPKTSLPTTLWQDVVKPLGTAGILGAVAVACVHRITVGRNIVEEDDPIAYAQQHHSHPEKTDKE